MTNIKSVGIEKFIEFFNRSDKLDVERAYENVGWFRRAVDIRAEAARSFPYDVIKDGEVQFTEDILQDDGTVVSRPDELDIFSLLDDIVIDLDLHGAFYAIYETNLFGKNGKWRRLHPRTIKPLVDKSKGLTGFERTAGNSTVRYGLDEILHVWLPARSVEAGHGKGLAHSALMAATGLHNTERFQNAFFENGALNPTIVSIDGFEDYSSDEQSRVKKVFRRIMTGLSNAFDVIPMAGNVSVSNLMQPLKDMAMQELIQTHRQTIATALGVPHSLLFSDAANYATASQDDLNFYDKTIVPLMSLIEQQLNEQLFKREEHLLRFQKNRLEVYQVLETQKSERLNSMLDRNVITIAEYREWMNLPVRTVEETVEEEPEEAQETEQPESVRTYQNVININTDSYRPVRVKNIPDRYSDIDFVPPEGVQERCERGVEQFEDGYGGDGLEDVTIREARAIARGEAVTVAKARKGYQWWSRNERFLDADTDTPADVAANLWGGRPGDTWFKKLGRQMNAADEEANKSVDIEHTCTDSCNHSDELPYVKLFDGMSDELYALDTMQERTVDELKTWYAFEKKRSGKSDTRNFETQVIEPFIRYAVIDRIKDADDLSVAIIDVLEDERVKTALTYRRKVRSIFNRFWRDRITISDTFFEMSKAIEKQFTLAFKRGVKRGGRSYNELSPSDQAELDILIQDEKSNVFKLLRDIQAAKLDENKKIDEFRHRSDMWAARYDRIEEVGYIIGSEGKMLKWSKNPLKENCVSCNALDGTVKSAEDWRRADIEPRSPKLACFGSFCGCDIEETDDEITEGAIPLTGIN